jgi:hypothetical protein
MQEALTNPDFATDKKTENTIDQYGLVKHKETRAKQ